MDRFLLYCASISVSIYPVHDYWVWRGLEVIILPSKFILFFTLKTGPEWILCQADNGPRALYLTPLLCGIYNSSILSLWAPSLSCSVYLIRQEVRGLDRKSVPAVLIRKVNEVL